MHIFEFLPYIVIRQHWSGAIMPASPADLWPPGRYLHSACVLFAPTPSSASEGSSKEISHSPSSDMSAGQHSPQLFVLWGFGRYCYLFLAGVKSLYYSCVDYVAERYNLYQPLLQQLLPPHIQTDISRERDKRVNRAHYRVVQL